MTNKLPEIQPGQACAAPSKRYPNGATGTGAGRSRHRRAGEPVCRPCQDAHNAGNAVWRAANPHYSTEWRRANADSVNERRRELHDADPEKRNAYNRQWRTNNLDQARATQRRWKANNPGKAKASNARFDIDKKRDATRRRRARLHKARSDIGTTTLFPALVKRDGTHCYICGATAVEVDHVIPLSKGGEHTWANVRLICVPCNRSKSNSCLYDWLRLRHLEGKPVSGLAWELAADGAPVVMSPHTESRDQSSERCMQLALEL